MAYTDFQGSLSALTDESGNVLEKYAFDPWGNRRDPDDWSQEDSRKGWLVDRGYTLHEHLDAFGIINMNGRVYDPLTAVFFSPDPRLQSPDNWLNYNRYAYCLNNPFRYTDPSGYTWISHLGGWVGNNWKSMVTTTAAITVGVVVGACTAGLGDVLLVGAIAGGASGLTGGILGTALNKGTFIQCLEGGGGEKI